jgi:hypothetical protein
MPQSPSRASVARRIALPAAIAFILAASAGGAQAQVPTIDVQATCKVAAAVMFNLGTPGAGRNDVDICVDSENKARQQLISDWSKFAASDREGCIQTRVYLPSYVEWLTCFEMNKVVREAKQQQGREVLELYNPDGSMTLPPLNTLGISLGRSRMRY